MDPQKLFCIVNESLNVASNLKDIYASRKSTVAVIISCWKETQMVLPPGMRVHLINNKNILGLYILSDRPSACVCAFMHLSFYHCIKW